MMFVNFLKQFEVIVMSYDNELVYYNICMVNCPFLF